MQRYFVEIYAQDRSYVLSIIDHLEMQHAFVF
jgi:hypothetical protein